MTGQHEIWHESHATGGHHTLTDLLNFITKYQDACEIGVTLSQ